MRSETPRLVLKSSYMLFMRDNRKQNKKVQYKRTDIRQVLIKIN